MSHAATALTPDADVSDTLYDLPHQVTNALGRLGVLGHGPVTPRDIAKITYERFRSQPQVGPKAINALRTLLARAGLDLAEAPETSTTAHKPARPEPPVTKPATSSEAAPATALSIPPELADILPPDAICEVCEGTFTPVNGRIPRHDRARPGSCRRCDPTVFVPCRGSGQDSTIAELRWIVRMRETVKWLLDGCPNIDPVEWTKKLAAVDAEIVRRKLASVRIEAVVSMSASTDTNELAQLVAAHRAKRGGRS